MDSVNIKIDRSKFNRKQYRNNIKTLRKHLRWDGLDIANNCKIVFKIDDESTPLVITDSDIEYYYHAKTGKLLYRVEKAIESAPPLIILE